MALKAGQGIASAGGDPVIEIERILKSKGKVDQIHEGWDEWVRDNFPATQPPAPMTPEPDTIPFADAPKAGPDKSDTQPSMPAISKEDLLDSDPPEEEDPYEGL